MKNLPGQVGQLALVQYRGAIVKYIYNGTHWVATPETLNYGAPRVADMPIYTSCKQRKLANPKAKDGVYTIDPDGAGGNSPIQAYCDMTTDGGGWTLVASWDDAAEWTKTSYSTNVAFLQVPRNAFSSNFGNLFIHQFRIKASDSIDAAAKADFYYNWKSGTLWKEVWASGAGYNQRWTSSTPRQALKKFDNAYNIKYHTRIQQIWANISDQTNGESANWWEGLTIPGIALGVYSLSNGSDGSLALSPSNHMYDSGQDVAFNVKIGYDVGQKFIRLGGGNTTNTYGQQSSGVDSNTKVWFWVR